MQSVGDCKLTLRQGVRQGVSHRLMNEEAHPPGRDSHAISLGDLLGVIGHLVRVTLIPLFTDSGSLLA